MCIKIGYFKCMLQKIMLFLVCLIGLAHAQSDSQPAFITEVFQKSGVWNIKADYIVIRETDNVQGFEIINQNPLIRTFKITPKTRIKLLKSAGEYFNATVQQLIQGRKGKDFGWMFDVYTPFYLKVNDKDRTVIEMTQMYLP